MSFPETIEIIEGQPVNVQHIKPGDSVEVEIRGGLTRKYQNTSGIELWYIPPQTSWTDAYSKIQATPWYKKWIAISADDDLKKECGDKIDKWEERLAKADQARKAKILLEKPTMTSCINEYLVVTDKSDPFEIKRLIAFQSRYVATLAKTFYPKQEQFHLRGFHYRLQRYAIVWFKGRRGKYHLDRYGGNPTSTEYYAQNDAHFDDLIEFVKLARFAGLIPMEQILEKRITTGVLPADPEVVPKLTNKTFEVKIHAEIAPIKDFKLQYNIPLIVLFSEKSEMQPIFEELSKRYFLSYYIGAGEISPTSVRDIYDYIKKYATTGIILTFTDADLSGITIPINFARKMQWFIERDQHQAPSIIMYPFALNEIHLRQLREMDIRPIIRQYSKKTNVPLKVYELDALDALAGELGTSLIEYLDFELRKLLPVARRKEGGTCETWEGTLLPRSTAITLLDSEFLRLKKELTTNLEQVTAQLKERGTPPEAFAMVSGWRDADDYAQKLLASIKTSPAFQALESAASATKFDPCDVSIEKPQFNPIPIKETKTPKYELQTSTIEQEAAIPPDIQLKFGLLTKHLNDLRERKRKMMAVATKQELEEMKKAEKKAMPG